MNIAELKSSIIKNSLPSVLVFTGEELGVMNIYLDEICSKLSYSVHKLDKVEDAVRLCSGKSIIQKNKLFIVTDDNEFLKDDKSWGKLNSLLGNNKLILKYHNHESKVGFWKYFETSTVVFEHMTTDILAKHLVKEFDISLDNALKVVENCDCDYTRCLLELDKARALSKSTKASIDDIFNECVETGVFCFDTYLDIFNFVTSLLTKNFKDAIKIYDLLLAKDEPVLKVLNAVYNSFKNVLVAQTMHSAKNIKQNSGISYYSYIKAKEVSGHYSNEEIENILYILMTLEQGIKTGKINQEFAIDFLLLNL